MDRRSFGINALAAAGFGMTPALARPKVSGRVKILAPFGSQANLVPVRQSFEALTGVATELMVVGVNEINAVLALEALTGEFGIDVALPATFGLPELVEAQAIVPLDGALFQTEQALYQVGDFFDGQRWGYQTDGDVYLMFYNARMMTDPDAQARYEDAYGTPLTAPRRWSDVDRQMMFFHQPGQGRFGGSLFRGTGRVVWEWWARFHANGMWPFGPQMEPQIDGDAGVSALEDMIRSADHLVGQKLELFDNWDRFRNGDVYACIGWGGTQKRLFDPGSPIRRSLVNAPLPGVETGTGIAPFSYFNWGWSYVVTRRSRNAELAQMFCANAVSRNVSTAAISQTDGFFDPFLEHQYEDPDILDAYGAQFLALHHNAMKAPVPDLYLSRRSEYVDALNYWLLAALAGDVAPGAALTHVAETWRSTTDRAGPGKQIARWSRLRSAYPAALQRVLRDG